MLMVVVIIISVRAALTGRIGCDSTAGLAVVSAACLAMAQLDECVRDGHPQLRGKRGVVA